MAANGGVGVEFDLDKIPNRETGMIPYEYLLSESQERMLFVAQKGREQELIDIFVRWGLNAVVAGKVIEEPIVRILYQGEIAAEIPATALAENTPIYNRELLKEPPEYARKAWEWTPDNLPACTHEGIEIKGKLQTWNDILLTLLDTPTIASKSWVYRQYDHQVQNNTVMLPGGADAAIVRLRPVGQDKEIGREDSNAPSPMPDAQKGVAATVDCNSRYVYLDPYEGAKAVVAEAARNLSCVGAEPLAVTDNLNFGSPEKPIGYWQLSEACRGLAEGCQELSTPVTGGNVSLYNETFDTNGNPKPIYPTPVVGMVGLIPDLTKICSQAWQSEGDIIYLLGLPIKSKISNSQSENPQSKIQNPSWKVLGEEHLHPKLSAKSKIELGGSEYLATIHETVAGKPPSVDFDLERRVQQSCREGIRRGWVRSAHDCAEGGITVALAECCINSHLGAEIKLDLPANNSQRWDEVLFGEGGARIIVSVALAQQENWESYLQEHLLDNWQKIGKVGNSQTNLGVFTIDNKTLINVTIEDVSDRYYQSITKRLAVHQQLNSQLITE
jgi:phosphoribosylformylglycinamidine synthase